MGIYSWSSVLCSFGNSVRYMCFGFVTQIAGNIFIYEIFIFGCWIYWKLVVTDLASKTLIGGGGKDGARMQIEMLVCELVA